MRSTSRVRDIVPIRDKIADYFGAGTGLVWLVDPSERRALVRYADRASRVLTDRDVLDGEALVPGFALLLAELFTG